MSASARSRAAEERLAAWAPEAAVIYGSGLAHLPDGAEVEAESSYRELGWPCTAVPGHENLLRLVAVPHHGGRRVRLALLCGRPHLYEGWSDAELAAPVEALARAGVRRLVITNSCGGLRPESRPGCVVVCPEVVDLQRPPQGRDPERLPVCTAAQAWAVAAALGGAPLALSGTYVALPGPQFETVAEVAWLRRYGAVVGMSAAPELRAARRAGLETVMLGLVANRAADVSSHEDVLVAGAAFADILRHGVMTAAAARWPGGWGEG